MARRIYAVAVACAAIALLPLDAAVANAPAAQAGVSNHDHVRQAFKAGEFMVVARGKNTARTRGRGR